LKRLINFLIVGCVLASLYVFAGHHYAKFYFGGKAEILDLASSINDLCNTTKSCPETLEGWQVSSGRKGSLRKDNMFYYPVTRNGGEKSTNNKEYNEFTLVYGFFAPDHWFEAKGGVGRSVTSGWMSRDTSP
jgi:hypothetical protein